MTDDAQRRGFRAVLEQRCLAGLASAASGLVGGDPEAVCSAFASWREEAWRGWPWLPGLCWEVLEPLGVTFPTEDGDVVSIGRVLVGAETDPDRYREAIEAVVDRLDHQPAWEPVPAAGADLTGELRRRSLSSAVDQFWADLAAAMRRLHEPVCLRDRHRADGIVVAARRQLEESAERLERLVERVGEHRPEPDAAPVPDQPVEPATDPPHADAPASVLGPPAPEPAAEPAEEPEGPSTEPLPVVSAPVVRGNAVRSTRPHQPTAPPRAEPTASTRRPSGEDDDVEYRTVREHRYAPVVFLVGVTVGALIWLAYILAGGS